MRRRVTVLCMWMATFAFGLTKCDHGAPPELPPHEKVCAGKRCGEVCTLCKGDNTGCSDTVLTRACNGVGECVPAPVDCTKQVKW